MKCYSSRHRPAADSCSLLAPVVPEYTIIKSLDSSSKSEIRGITLWDCVDLLTVESALEYRRGAGPPPALPSPSSSFSSAAGGGRHSAWKESLSEPHGWAEGVESFDQERLVGFEGTMEDLVSDISTHFLPMAVRDVLMAGVNPAMGLLLEGATGTGKTFLLRAAAAFFAQNPRCVAHTEMVRCRELLEKPTLEVLTALTDAFERAKRNAPTLLCLDDLDRLCPSQSKLAEEGGAMGSSGLEEKVGLISLHLNRLCEQLDREVRDGFRTARRVCRDDSHLKCFDTRCSGTDCFAFPRGGGGGCFLVEEVLSRALFKSVYFLASASSFDSIRRETSFFPFHLLKRSLPIQPLRNNGKIAILRRALEKLGCPWNAAESLAADVRRDELYSILDGFTVSDINNFATRISAVVYSKTSPSPLFSVPVEFRSVIRSPLTGSNPEDGFNGQRRRLCTMFEDIREAAKQFAHSSSAIEAKIKENLKGPGKKVSWADIGGFESVKNEIFAVIRLPSIFSKIYREAPLRLPRAILLYGPPGCGKTLFAQAAGNDFGANFICVRGPQLLDKYIGASEKVFLSSLIAVLGSNC